MCVEKPSEEQAFHLSGSVTYDILSRDMADRVPPDAMADLSRATRVVSNLSRASRVTSGDIRRVHQKISPPQVVLLQLDGKLLHVKVKTKMDREDIANITVP